VLNVPTITDWLLVGVTGALVIIAALQLWAFVAQRGWMKRTTEVMLDTEQRQLRAYVSVVANEKPHCPQAIADDPTHCRVEVVACNRGQTPAYSISHFPNRVFTQSRPQMGKPPIPSDVPSAYKVLSPGETMPLSITIEKAKCDSADSGRKECYFYGVVAYRDAFAHDWYTEYILTFAATHDSQSDSEYPHLDYREVQNNAT